MNDYFDTEGDIDQALEQAKVDELLGDVDIGYIKECIENQIESILETGSKNNYLKYLRKQLEKTTGLDEEYKRAITDNLYQRLIEQISDKMEFTIDDTEVPREVMANNLYKFFVLQYPLNVVLFIEMVIIEEKHTIAKELEGTPGLNSKRIPGLSSEISIILYNLSKVINIIAGMNYTFEDFLDFVIRHEDSKSSAEEIKKYYEEYMDNTDNIVPIYMRNLIDENEGFADIYCDLQNRIYSRFVKD